MRNNRSKNKNEWSKIDKQMIIFIIIASLLLISLIYSVFTVFKSDDIDQVRISYSDGQEISTDKVQNIKGFGEHDRIKKYMGELMGYMNAGKYRKMYEKMYPEYKSIYFKTYEDFEKYMTEVIPDNTTFSEVNFERIGEFYIYKIDLFNSSNLEDPKNRKGMFFVFKEYDFYDYHYSFSKEEFNVEEALKKGDKKTENNR